MMNQKVVPESVKKFLGWPTKHERYSQAIPEVVKVGVPAPAAPLPSSEGSSMFPNETVIYFDQHRNMVVSTDYDEKLIRPLPLFVIAIGFAGGADGENAIIPLTIHRGHDTSGPIYGWSDKIERHPRGTINNHAYNPSAPFATTVIDIGAHLTREFCSFELRTQPNPSSDPSAMTLETFKWKQMKGDPAVLDLACTRAIDAHDWSWAATRGEKRGLKLFREATGECLAVYVAGKQHSKMNPVRIAARIRWFESETWTEELKIASFLALMTYGEKTRRVKTSGGM